MTDAPRLTRRHALMAAAALPVVASGLIGTAPRAAAKAEMMGAGVAPFRRYGLGQFEVTTLLAGTRTVPEPQKIFGLNASADDFAAASEAAFIPTDRAQFFFTPTVVNTGAELILFDTGLSPEGIVGALAAAGYTPDQVDIVVLTHMHGDHIGGLSGDSGVTFPNARYVTGSVEHNHWSAAANEGFDAKVKPLNDQMTFLEGGASVASGITAVDAQGHTPGHMGYMLESGGQSLMLIADAANHFVWSLAKPDWEVSFDTDKAQAAATRRALFGQLAADRTPFIGYHMPFPALGYAEARGDGFHYVPASYQLIMSDG